MEEVLKVVSINAPFVAVIVAFMIYVLKHIREVVDDSNKSHERSHTEAVESHRKCEEKHAALLENLQDQSNKVSQLFGQTMQVLDRAEKNLERRDRE